MSSQWFNAHRDNLRKINLRWVEQLCNQDSTRVRTWAQTYINLNKKSQGRIPTAFLDIIHKLTDISQTESESSRDLLQPKHQPNPFKQWHDTSHHTTKELKDNNMDWVLQVNTPNLTIGKVRKRNSTTTTFRHYNADSTQ